MEKLSSASSGSSRTYGRSYFAALAFLCWLTPCAGQTVVIRNIAGYTPTAAGAIQSFDRLTIIDGRVQSLAADAAVPQGATVIDGAGKAVLPGLIDAHGHMLGLGEQRLQVDLRGTPTLAAAIERVRQFAEANRANRWVMGRGWNQVLWPGKQFPTAADLDAIVRERPVLLSRVDGHAIWVNTAALKLASIGPGTPDPKGGQIIRDAKGNPTGVLVDAATNLIEQHVPPATDEELKRTLATAMKEIAGLGLTGVHDAGIDMRQYHAYEALGAADELPIRVYAMLLDGPAARSVIAAGPQPPKYGDRLQLRAVKAVVDGALGSRGAALLADYRDQPGNRGLMLYTPTEFETLSTLAAGKGWQLNVHAIGDAGNRLVLDTFAKTMTPAQRAALRPRIEHAQVVALSDIPRFAQLNVIASIQPTHATSDMNMAEDRVGAERIKGAYAWRQLLTSGARLAGGSDFPVELPNPFHGLYAAVTRQDRAGKPPGGWYGGEKLTREEALRLFTLDAAYAGHMEKTIGSLEAGKWADFIVLDRDYFKVPEQEIDDIGVVDTYVAGRRVAGR